MAVHEKEGGIEEIGISQPDLAFLLDFESGCARDQAHEVLSDAAAIIAIIGAVADAAHEEGGLFVVGSLSQSGEGGEEEEDGEGGERGGWCDCDMVETTEVHMQLPLLSRACCKVHF